LAPQVDQYAAFPQDELFPPQQSSKRSWQGDVTGRHGYLFEFKKFDMKNDFYSLVKT